MSKFNVWMSVSDLMTGLMVIFLFIAIAYIIRVRDNQSVLNDYVDTKKELHDKLVQEFANDAKVWNMSIGKDLSMKFENADGQFASGSEVIEPGFQNILDQFIPKYLDILLHDSLSSKIKEIRIEGHTDNVPCPRLHSDPYLGNVYLSQRRAASVLAYIRNMECYNNYSEEDKRKLDFWFTANGLSYGRAVDSNGEFTYNSGNPIDLARSRRVEFRIITEGEEVLENFVNKNK